MYKAVQNGYTIIRLIQLNVYYNKNDWKNKLVQLIKKYDKPCILYVNNGNKYDNGCNDNDSEDEKLVKIKKNKNKNIIIHK